MSLKEFFSILSVFLFYSPLSPALATIPPEARSFDVNVKLIGFSAEQKEKVSKAVELIKKVVASEEFRLRILNKKHKGKAFFVDSDLSNEEIYSKILAGAEEVGDTSKNNRMDLEIKLYQDKSKTIGYTYPHIVRIYVNRKYFDKFQPHQVADNLFHEWLHKLGFKHSIKKNPDRAHSVPYSIGYMVKDLARQQYALTHKTAINENLNKQQGQEVP
jgi:hypothetical protein